MDNHTKDSQKIPLIPVSITRHYNKQKNLNWKWFGSFAVPSWFPRNISTFLSPGELLGGSMTEKSFNLIQQIYTVQKLLALEHWKM
jgi:hypothetical protein